MFARHVQDPSAALSRLAQRVTNPQHRAAELWGTGGALEIQVVITLDLAVVRILARSTRRRVVLALEGA